MYFLVDESFMYIGCIPQQKNAQSTKGFVSQLSIPRRGIIFPGELHTTVCIQSDKWPPLNMDSLT